MPIIDVNKPPHWAFVAGLIITAGAAISVTSKATLWAWNVTAAPALQCQIDKSIEIHAATEKVLVGKIDTIVNRIDELRLQNVRNEAMLRMLVRRDK